MVCFGVRGEKEKRDKYPTLFEEYYWRGGRRMLMIDILFSLRYYKKRKRILENFPKPSKVLPNFSFSGFTHIGGL